ncbi:MAG TPA: hypothetical protein VFA85_19830 [Terriglobales bacterium]|nr:hypothetical protein [Terriglobales bacterium]
MKKSILMGALMTITTLAGIVPRVMANTGDTLTFGMVRAEEATCLPPSARGRVTISDLGPVQNMHLEVFGLTPNNSFTVFVTQHGKGPFGVSWYQGEVNTDKNGNGVADYTGIFSEETFVLSAGTPISLAHLGIWFADPNDAAMAGCPGDVTRFDGDGVAGILVLSTSNFSDAHGPLLKLKEEDEPPAVTK